VIKALIAKVRNVPYAWSMGYAAGRIASDRVVQEQWSGVIARLVERASRAETELSRVNKELQLATESAFHNAVRAERLEAMLQTRNLNGGFFPNG